MTQERTMSSIFCLTVEVLARKFVSVTDKWADFESLLFTTDELMRKIDPNNFRIATRGTPRQINRQIVLNLVRARPISRAELARSMNMRRGAVSLLVNELIEEGIIFEGATGETSRGRKPKFLFVETRSSCAVAVDIRASRTYFMVTDLVGRPLVGISSFPTERDPNRFVEELAMRIRRALSDHEELGKFAGVGIVVPGMSDHTQTPTLFSPPPQWHNPPSPTPPT